MYWTLSATGTKRGVLKFLQEHQGPNGGQQYAQAKAFLIAEVEALPEGAGVAIEATGNVLDNGARPLTIRVVPTVILGDPLLPLKAMSIK
jgi:hypothetical protein